MKHTLKRFALATALLSSVASLAPAGLPIALALSSVACTPANAAVPGFDPLAKISVVAGFGDSISSEFGGSPSWYRSYQPAVRAHFVPTVTPPDPETGLPAIPPGHRWPRFFISASAGQKVGDVSPTLDTTLDGYRVTFTHVIGQFGINDAAAIAGATLTGAQFSINAAQFIAKAQSRLANPRNVIIIGPWAHDSGDLNTQVADVNARWAAACAAANVTYVTWSTIPNTVGTYAQSDGTHPAYPIGTDALAAAVIAAVPMQ